MQANVDAACDDPCGDVGGLHAAIGEGDRAGFNGFKGEFAGVHIARGAAPAGEVRIRRATGFVGGGKQAGGVGLPDFNHGIAQRCSSAVIDDTFDGDLPAYEKWLLDYQKQSDQSADKPENLSDNESSEDKKERKRLAAELRKRISPLRKQLDKDEKSIDRLNHALEEIEGECLKLLPVIWRG